MNSLSCLAVSLSRSLGSQNLRKEENEDTKDTTKDQRSTPSELNFKQTVPDKSDIISPLSSEEEPNLALIVRNKGTPSLRTHRCTRCSKLHLVLMVLLMTEANNALSTTSHLPTFDDAANPGAPKPLHKLDANSIILILILLVVTYNATRNSVYTHNQNMTTTCGMIAEYAKPRYAQSYTDPEDRIFKKLFLL
jgi:hypothetical protein